MNFLYQFPIVGLSSRKQQSVILVVFVLISYIDNSNLVDALQCYKCTMTSPSPHTNETVRLCSNFDYSERYIVDCPYSTLCMKKDLTVRLSVPINGTERDCALQRYDYQDYQDGKWQLKVAIEEPYTEGCSSIDDKGLRSSRTEYCYCRGDFCNTSTSIPPNMFIVMTIISYFIIF